MRPGRWTRRSLELSLLNYKEDADSTAKELDAVLAYQDKLKPQCESKVMSRRERATPQPAAPTGCLRRVFHRVSKCLLDRGLRSSTSHI